MNYKKLYNEIILNSQLRQPLDGYVENHHIIPSSLGGSDDKINITKLTAREHFICHYLLVKIQPINSIAWYKMNNAFIIMNGKTHENRYINSRLYETLRKNFSLVMSFNQQGKKNSQYGKIWIYNTKLEETKKIEKSELVLYKNNGWLKGRKLDWTKQRHIECVICGVETNNRQTCSKECRKKLQTKQQELEYKIGTRKMGGSNNPSFGKIWIYNLELKLSKKIQKDEYSTWKQDGWLKGRKMKF